MLKRIRELLVMTMWRRLFRNIDYNFNQVLIGLSIISISLFLWLDKNYFTWPPELRPIMNSKYFDIIFMLLGIILLFLAIVNKEIKIYKKWTLKGIVLIIAGGATLVLLIEQLSQVFFAKNIEMIIAVIFDVFLFALILRLALDS